MNTWGPVLEAELRVFSTVCSQCLARCLALRRGLVSVCKCMHARYCAKPLTYVSSKSSQAVLGGWDMICISQMTKQATPNALHIGSSSQDGKLSPSGAQKETVHLLCGLADGRELLSLWNNSVAQMANKDLGSLASCPGSLWPALEKLESPSLSCLTYLTWPFVKLSVLISVL